MTGVQTCALPISALISDNYNNTKHISNGDTLITREQVDGVRYISATTTTNVNPAYTPFERATDKSIIARMLTGGKLIYSFYTDSEDLVCFPTCYCGANTSLKMSLDFGLPQPSINLSTKSVPIETVNTTSPSIFNNTSSTAITYRKDIMLSRGIEPLRIIRKGWHTLLVECDNAVFSGIDFMSLSDWKNMKERFNVVNLGSSVYSVNYNTTYSMILGKVSIPLPLSRNVYEITSIPSNFVVLNRQATITNKETDSVCSLYTENNRTYIEVNNSGILSETRVAMIDYSLFGYYV